MFACFVPTQYQYQKRRTIMDKNIIAARQEIQETINNVTFVGSVIHKYRPRPNIITLTVAVGNSGIPGIEDSRGVNYPNVTFYGEDIADAIDRSIVIEGKNYPRVRIEGEVHTTRREVPGDKPRFYQNVIGVKIRRAETNMEAMTGKSGIGSKKLAPVNEICIMGNVTRVYPVMGSGERPIVAVVTVHTRDNGRDNFPHISCFGSKIEDAMNLKKGERVCVTGFLETNYRERDGRRVRLESIVATEIAKVEAEE